MKYEIAGSLLRSASQPMADAFVLDFGLRAYTEWTVLDDLEPPAEGDWLTGEIYLSVGPDDGPMLVPDPSRESWRTVSQTRTWEEGSYRLRCKLENLESTSSMGCNRVEVTVRPAQRTVGCAQPGCPLFGR